MKYRYGRGVTKKPKTKRKLLLTLPVFGLFVGGYVAILAIAPSLAFLSEPANTVAAMVTETKPGSQGNRLFMPTINTDVALVQGSSPTALDSGAWFRNPTNGTPGQNGHVALSARSFHLGATPVSTKIQSPFYHLNKLQTGDEIFLDYNDSRFVYEITDVYSVSRAVSDIELPSKESKLTLYSYQQNDSTENREIIEAAYVGELTWKDNQAVLLETPVW